MQFLSVVKKKIMSDKKEFERNQPSEEGRDNDPQVRDESAPQPGVNTMSKSGTDRANEQLTKTTIEGDRPEDSSDQKRDARFDEIGAK